MIIHNRQVYNTKNLASEIGGFASFFYYLFLFTGMCLYDQLFIDKLVSDMFHFKLSNKRSFFIFFLKIFLFFDNISLSLLNFLQLFTFLFVDVLLSLGFIDFFFVKFPGIICSSFFTFNLNLLWNWLIQKFILFDHVVHDCCIHDQNNESNAIFQTKITISHQLFSIRNIINKLKNQIHDWEYTCQNVNDNNFFSTSNSVNFWQGASEFTHGCNISQEDNTQVGKSISKLIYFQIEATNQEETQDH